MVKRALFLFLLLFILVSLQGCLDVCVDRGMAFPRSQFEQAEKVLARLHAENPLRKGKADHLRVEDAQANTQVLIWLE